MLIYLVTFFCGAFVMTLETCGARLLAPHVGTSPVVWTSVIGMVLLFLALGSWLGGILAKNRPGRKMLAGVLAAACIGMALTAALTPLYARLILSVSRNLYIAAIALATGIYGLPNLFLGMVMPLALTCFGSQTKRPLAQLAGILGFFSTLGSLAGTFLGGFLLVGYLPSTRIIWILSAGLFILAIALGLRRGALLCMAAALPLLALNPTEQGLERFETPLSVIELLENDKYVLMRTDPGYWQAGMEKANPDKLLFSYTKFLQKAAELHPSIKNVLLIGGGGYSLPRHMLSDLSYINPQSFRVVELDEKVSAIAASRFGLPSVPRLEVITADGREYINRRERREDLILVDAFNSSYNVPFQLCTTQAIENYKENLNPGGILAINLISAVTGEDGRLFRAIYKGLTEHFPETRVYLVGDKDHPEQVQNIVLISINGKPVSEGPLPYSPRKDPDSYELEAMEKHRYLGEIPDDVPAFTDDFAPVERFTMMLPRYEPHS